MAMKKLPFIPSLLFASAMGFVAPLECEAQQLKLDIKVFAGGSGTTYVGMLETGRERDTFVGWQAGFGARVHKRKWFGEVLLSFNRWTFAASEQSADGNVRIKGRVNSFELPFIGGVVPYSNAYFKLFIYGGLVNHFNTKILASETLELPGQDPINISVKLKPKDIDLAIYQALARFGVSFDLAMFNFDFNYSITMNSATTTSYRTGYHQIQVNLAYLF